MPGGGTTGGGSFRFPYDFTELVSDIRAKMREKGADPDWERIADDFTALYMDRDRALEDYTTYAATPSTTAFHAFVDNSQATDASINRYAGISEAINAMASIGDHLAIWIRNTGTPYTETVVASRASNTVTLVAESGFPELASGGGTVQWTTTGFLPNVGTLILHNIWIDGGTSQNGIVGTSTSNVVGFNCIFSAPIGSMWPTSVTGGTLHMVNCVVNRMNMNVAKMNWYGGIYYVDPSNAINWTNPGAASSVEHNVSDVRISGGSCNISIAAGSSTTYLNMDNFGCGSGPLVPAAGGANFTVPSGAEVKWNNRIPRGAFSGDSITLTNPGSAVISGGWNNITRTNTGGDGMVQIDAFLRGALDVAGPAMINASVSTSSIPVKLSGSGINARVDVRYSGSTQAGVQCASLVDSVVVIHASITSAQSVRPLTLDTGCARNVVTLTGQDTNWGLAYSDSGTNNLILTRNGSPPVGAAGGDLAGTYPSPTVAGLSALSNFNAKGDLLVATADNTPARLGVGTDQRELAADSSATTGVSWRYTRALVNRLTQNQASLETDTTGWTARTGSTIARTTSQSSHGAASLEITKS